MKMEFAEQQENAALIQALQDAGCDKAAIEDFMKLKAIRNKKEMLRLLAVHRSKLLCKIHETQKPLDTLDYLIFKLKKEACF